MTKYERIHESPYGDAPDNYHLTRAGDELHLDLTYPPRSDAANKGRIRYVVFDQESVRASDGIRISYDYERDGYKIEQASIFSWAITDKVCDPGWIEVAFVQAWSQEIEEPGDEPENEKGAQAEAERLVARVGPEGP